MRPRRHDAQNVLGNQIRREPAHPRPRNRAHDEPPARLDKRPHLVEKRARVVNVLDDFEQRDHVVALSLGRDLELLYGRLLVGELLGQRRVLARMCFRNAQDGRRGVNGRDVLGRGQPGRALGKDAAAAANVEVRDGAVGAAVVEPRRRVGGLETAADEVVAQGVHQVQQARGPVRIPPLGGQGIEVRDLVGVDGRGRG